MSSSMLFKEIYERSGNGIRRKATIMELPEKPSMTRAGDENIDCCEIIEQKVLL